MFTVEIFSTWLRARLHSDRGASLVEYALLVAFIAIVCIAAVTLLGTNTSGGISQAGNSLAN